MYKIMLRKIMQFLCVFTIIYSILFGYTEYREITNLEQVQSKINEKNNAFQDIELNKISNNQILVRNFIINYSNVSDDTLKWYAKQIEECPAYLFNTVDEIFIISHEQLLANNKNRNEDTIACHVHNNSYSVIYLSDYETSDQTIFEHEAIHAYDAEYGITNQLSFISIYQAEGLNYDERADDIKEYFAYSYVDFLEYKLDKEEYPKTYAFYLTLN